MFVYTLLAILPLLVFGVEVLPEVDAVENGVYIPTQFSVCCVDLVNCRLRFI